MDKLKESLTVVNKIVRSLQDKERKEDTRKSSASSFLISSAIMARRSASSFQQKAEGSNLDVTEELTEAEEKDVELEIV